MMSLVIVILNQYHVYHPVQSRSRLYMMTMMTTMMMMMNDDIGNQPYCHGVQEQATDKDEYHHISAMYLGPLPRGRSQLHLHRCQNVNFWTKLINNT